MTGPIPASALVLVAIITTRRDLEIARVLGWYRIPLRRAPKVIAVDYLAFYQTAAFGTAERWKVNYAAEVKGHELATRRQLLKDEPDHPRASEEYYKVGLGPLFNLERPIAAPTWKRLTFLYTTGSLCIQSGDGQRPGGALRGARDPVAQPARAGTAERAISAGRPARAASRLGDIKVFGVN